MDILNQLKETETADVYEIIFEDDNDGLREELTCKNIKSLNLAGYVYQGSQTDIDFDDFDEKGNAVTRYMDIHYFVKIDIKAVNAKMDQFFPA